MDSRALVSVALLAVIWLMMLGELRVSRRHQRELLARGAVMPPDPAYRWMRVAYPVVFLLMAIEGATIAPAPSVTTVVGLLLLLAAKALKQWAIATLGVRWTYRVVVLPGAPLVTGGPYRWLRHPNYVGVMGELVGMTLITGARISGPLSLLFFSWLLWRRIEAEERALMRGIY